jgi:xanthine dehydrogenase YagS FAD-binding subunit
MQPFGYTDADSLNGALTLLGAPGSMPLAGGTDVLQLLREGVIAPADLIDINGLPFSGIEPDGDGIRIGALTRLSAIADDQRVRERYPVLAQALHETASPQVRNMATAGGNLFQRTRCLYFRDVALPCNKREPGSGCPAQDGENRMNAILGGSDHCIAAYAGDMANALLVLDAEVSVAGPEGERRIPLEDVHRAPGDTPDIETTLRPSEIVTAIHLPASPRANPSHYLKLRDRATFEWALVSVAVALEIAEDGTIRSSRLAAGGVATRPWRLRPVEHMLTNRRLSPSVAHAAADEAGHGVHPRPGNAFKVTLLRRAVERALLIAGDLA